MPQAEEFNFLFLFSGVAEIEKSTVRCGISANSWNNDHYCLSRDWLRGQV